MPATSKLSDGMLYRVADPDPVFLHGSSSGFGFQISLDPDPVSAQMEQKKLQKNL